MAANRKNDKTDSRQGNKPISLSQNAGFTLVELLISLAIVGIMSTGILYFMQGVYAQQMTTYHLAQRTQKALMMKAALDDTVSSAGSIAAPVLSSGTTQENNGHTPFSFGSFFSTLLYGNCPSQGIFGEGFNFFNNIGNNFFDELFFGGYNHFHTTATGGNSNLNGGVTIPTQPIAVTASSISFYWLTAHTKGGDELCQGTLQLTGNMLTYTIKGSANNGHSDCGSPIHSNQQTTDYPVGKGWSFSQPVNDTVCLGKAYSGTTPEAIVATDKSAHGMAPTEVSVCLPAM